MMNLTWKSRRLAINDTYIKDGAHLFHGNRKSLSQSHLSSEHSSGSVQTIEGSCRDSFGRSARHIKRCGSQETNKMFSRGHASVSEPKDLPPIQNPVVKSTSCSSRIVQSNLDMISYVPLDRPSG